MRDFLHVTLVTPVNINKAMEGIYKVTDNVYKILKVSPLSLLVFCLIPKLGGEWESHGTSGTDDLSSTTSVRRLR